MASTGFKATGPTPLRRSKLPGKELTAKEREKLLEAYLPPEPISSSAPSRAQSPSPKSKQRRRSSQKSHKSRRSKPLRHALHVLLYATISFWFSVFFRFRRSWRLVKSKVVSLLKYHHRTPEFIERDTKHLEQLPRHLSVILELHEDDEEQGTAGLEGLVNDACEIAAWTACAGIPFLSIYERTGTLKNYIPQTHARISQTLEAYFGPNRKPSLSVRAPHLQSYSPPNTPPNRSSSPESHDSKPVHQHLTVLLLSTEDGRDTLIDLTKTLSDMAQNGTLRPEQIGADLIDAELLEAVSTEPDLLILFSPKVVLNGYPPWQLRLTEIFHLPDNKGVNYQVFLRALYNYAKVEMRLGR